VGRNLYTVLTQLISAVSNSAGIQLALYPFAVYEQISGLHQIPKAPFLECKLENMLNTPCKEHLRRYLR